MKGLDRYLTSEPEDYFTPYYEQVMECLTDKFYEDNEAWCDGTECEDIIDGCYKMGWSPEDTAIVIPIYKKYKDIEKDIENKNKQQWQAETN